MGKALFWARVASVLSVAFPSTSSRWPVGDAGAGYGRVRSQPAQKREGRAKGLGWVLDISCLSDSFLAVSPSLVSCSAASRGRSGCWEEGWGERRRGMLPHAVGQGVGCGVLRRQGDFCACPCTVLLPVGLQPFLIFFFSSVCNTRGANPPKIAPFRRSSLALPQKKNSRGEMQGGGLLLLLLVGERLRGNAGCLSWLSAPAWHSPRAGEKDGLQLPGGHGFGSAGKQGLLPKPIRSRWDGAHRAWVLGQAGG